MEKSRRMEGVEGQSRTQPESLQDVCVLIKLGARQAILGEDGHHHVCTLSPDILLSVESVDFVLKPSEKLRFSFAAATCSKRVLYLLILLTLGRSGILGKRLDLLLLHLFVVVRSHGVSSVSGVAERRHSLVWCHCMLPTR